MTITTDRNRKYLERCIRNAREDFDKARDSLRSAEIARDEFELRQRPSYPTTGMRLAIERAVEEVKHGRDPGSSQSVQLGAGVSAHGAWGFIWINHGAPYGMASNGYLWTFTPAEVQRTIEHIEAFGLTVTRNWTHERGHSFQVEVAKRP